MIIVDTREQKPLWDIEHKAVYPRKLDEGDYTTHDLLGKAHIERKSGNDLYGSIIQGHLRFRKMLQRANAKDITLAVFVECPKEIFFAKKFKGGYLLKTPPKTLRKIVTTMQDRYKIEFVWCKHREDMRAKMLRWFANQRKFHGEKKEETEL